tara:strand:+ start:3004 stop:3462 length:459 start_codon:yes stop_codon:yes gene_type:complete
MSMLNLKVPPPVVLLISAVLMWMISERFPTNNEPQFRLLIAPILAGLGLSIAVSGILSFRRAATTVSPLTPERATSLVIVGIYKFTRNPMYLGLLLILIAWSVFLFSLYSALMLIVFVLYLTEFQIKPEEKALTTLFGDEYVAYTKSVRRWV